MANYKLIWHATLLHPTDPQIFTFQNMVEFENPSFNLKVGLTVAEQLITNLTEHFNINKPTDPPPTEKPMPDLES